MDEASPLVADDDSDYAVTKRDTDAALAEIDGLTRVVLRPAILGPGEARSGTPPSGRDPRPREGPPPSPGRAPRGSVDDLALAADMAAGKVATAADPADGPVERGHRRQRRGGPRHRP